MPLCFFGSFLFECCFQCRILVRQLLLLIKGNFFANRFDFTVQVKLPFDEIDAYIGIKQVFFHNSSR